MNERVRELYAQAAKQYYNDTGEPAMIQYIFAELLLRECIEHLEGNVAVPNLEHSITKTKCIRSIKEHFGVEE